MGDESRFTEETWNSWLTPFQAAQLLVGAGLDDRESAVNWLKGRLRNGVLKAAGWHIEMCKDDPRKVDHQMVVGRYIDATWRHIAAIPWKDDFWVSGDYEPDDPLDAIFRNSTRDEFDHYLTGVRFDPIPINDFCQQADTAAAPLRVVQTRKAAGGRPPKPFWDQLWPFIAAQLYNGDLKPQRQADIEKAMLDWIAANGHEAGESTARRAARALWQAINREDQN